MVWSETFRFTSGGCENGWTSYNLQHHVVEKAASRFRAILGRNFLEHASVQIGDETIVVIPEEKHDEKTNWLMNIAVDDKNEMAAVDHISDTRFGTEVVFNNKKQRKMKEVGIKTRIILENDDPAGKQRSQRLKDSTDWTAVAFAISQRPETQSKLTQTDARV